jgi:hypothetical protein
VVLDSDASDDSVHAVVSALIAVSSGAVLWIWAAHVSGKLEAWDGPLYFSRVVPALAVISACCGFLAPRHAWRWPALIYASQFVVMVAQAKRPIGPLAPLGFIMLVALAAVSAVPAYVGAFARRLWNRRFETGLSPAIQASRDRGTRPPPSGADDGTWQD